MLYTAYRLRTCCLCAAPITIDIPADLCRADMLHTQASQVNPHPTTGPRTTGGWLSIEGISEHEGGGGWGVESWSMYASVWVHADSYMYPVHACMQVTACAYVCLHVCKDVCPLSLKQELKRLMLSFMLGIPPSLCFSHAVSHTLRSHPTGSRRLGCL